MKKTVTLRTIVLIVFYLVLTLLYVKVTFDKSDIEGLYKTAKLFFMITMFLVFLIAYTGLEAVWISEQWGNFEIKLFKKKERQINANSGIINAEEIDWEQRMKDKKKIQEKIKNL